VGGACKEMIYYNPQLGILANQYEGGIPQLVPSDIALMGLNPLATANHAFTPDTQDAHGGQGETWLSDPMPFTTPDRNIVWDYNQNYQGTAPMDLQPQLVLPDPWDVS